MSLSERFRSRRAILTGMSGAIAGLVAVACGGEAAPAAPAPKAEPTKAPAAAAPTAAPAAAAPTVARSPGRPSGAVTASGRN
ncbi:MAG: hypothetical protein EBT22_12925 [Chloroflexi bacterium]|nr:hypothetical protein [Chloroflexota bacterium]